MYIPTLINWIYMLIVEDDDVIKPQSWVDDELV